MKLCKHQNAFTLIELLVVIGIIGILAAILLPAIKAALEKANKAQAQSEATGIANAIKAFYSEYSRYPTSGSDTADKTWNTDNVDIIKILTATETASPPKNSRKIPFLELSSSSTNSVGNFIDPWDTPYFIAIDYGFDNKVTTVPYGTMDRGVAVWSAGPDAQSVSGTPADDVKSW